jgi:hypothetical protein
VGSQGAGMEKNHAWCLLCVLPGPGSSQDSRDIQERGYAASFWKDKCSDALERLRELVLKRLDERGNSRFRGFDGRFMP